MPISVQQSIQTLQRYEMMTPAALLVVGHRPLAFVTGQLCYLVAPLAAILGWEAVAEWAAVLSDPTQSAQLMEALEDAA